MDYAEGKLIEQFMDDRLELIHSKVNWIIQAMRDSGAIPKAEKEQQQKKAD